MKALYLIILSALIASGTRTSPLPSEDKTEEQSPTENEWTEELVFDDEYEDQSPQDCNEEECIRRIIGGQVTPTKALHILKVAIESGSNAAW